jgi:penicillin-binding protein 2
MTDRHGEELVSNRPSFNIEFIKEDAPNPSDVLRELGDVLGIEGGVLAERLEKNRARRQRFEPKVLLKDVSRDVVARVSSNRHVLPGVFVSVTPVRRYPYHEMAAHIVGYLREATKAQLEGPRGEAFLPGDLVGQYGLELSLEQSLRGQRGEQQIIVNALGTRVGELASEPVVSGHALELTIDRGVQEAAEHALEGKRGSVVALDPKTGEILAMVSAPAFNPAIFSGDLTSGDWSHLSAEKRMLNRAIQGTYPPGSVFKVFMEAAILAEKAASPEERVHCPGSYWF